MKVIDRIILVTLVAGVWALVLKPGTPGAHHSNANHDCDIGGLALGSVFDTGVQVINWGGVSVECSH